MWKAWLIPTRDTLLNSYAMLFFSNDRRLAALILLVSFLNPYAGLGGIAALAVSIVSARLMGFGAEALRSGLHTYSSLLLGLGMGTFYNPDAGYWVLLAAASLLCTLLSAGLIGRLGRMNLPALSLAFILTMWLVILTAGRYSTVALTERNIYWLNEMYASGGSGLIRLVQAVEALPLPGWLSGFLRSLGAILFQGNVLAGALLAVGLLLHSRISLSLMAVGYASALGFISLMGADAPGIGAYNLGTNFMLVAVAVGGFYLVPSGRSYLWTVALVPVSHLLVVGLGRVTGVWGLPVYSLPFCLTVLAFLYTLQLTTTRRLVITPVQFHRPEENLYRYASGRDRLLHRRHGVRLRLPFLGEWTVGQGYGGDRTHRGDWAQALDFDIRDVAGLTYRETGTDAADYHCHGKPVLSPGDGIVDAVVDQVDDNPVGRSNTRENWGNTIVIRHADGLYSQLSHLRKGSVRVRKGDAVRRGDLVAACGSSGRSPEPHLHFQMQATPHVGSRTLAHPFDHYLEADDDDTLQLHSFTVPAEGARVSHPTPDPALQEAFALQPGQRLQVRAEGCDDEEWEVCTSPWNEAYLQRLGSDDYAYFLNDGTVFCFTHYYGRRDSLLHHFYRAAFQVLLSTERPVRVVDRFPLTDMPPSALRWLQDLLAPFHPICRLDYASESRGQGGIGRNASILSEGRTTVLGRERDSFDATVKVRDGRIAGFEYMSDDTWIRATCAP